MRDRHHHVARIALAVALAVSSGAATSHAAIVMLEPVRDNVLIENPEGARSNGASPQLAAGRTGQGQNSVRRALFAFDVAGSLPRGATIRRASLRLHLSGPNAEFGPRSFGLHRVQRDWGEGASSFPGGQGAPAELDDATWIHRFYDHAFWDAPGGDFHPAPSAEIVVAGDGFYTWGPTPAMRRDVQRWLHRPADNHGWILIGDESTGNTARRIASREEDNATRRPVLWIEFELDDDDESDDESDDDSSSD